MKEKPKKQKLTVHATGRKGGETTLKKYGKAHYRAIAKKRWEKVKKTK